MTMAISDNGLWVYRRLYSVRSAITATAELLVTYVIHECPMLHFYYQF